MVLLYIRQLKNEKTVPAIVWKKVSVIANAIEFIINQTVTLAGILIVTVITLDVVDFLK